MRTRPRAIGCQKNLRRGLQEHGAVSANRGRVRAGPAGLVSALALDALGCEVALVAPAYDAARAARGYPHDSPPVIERHAPGKPGGLEAVPACGGSLASIRIIDDRGDLLRAPEVLFRASELGLANFGANITNPALIAALNAAAQAAPRLRHLATSGVVRVTPTDTTVRLDLAEGGSFEAALVVAADGRGSLARGGGGHREQHLAVSAVGCRRSLPAFSRPQQRQHRIASARGSSHHGALPGNMSSLVWVDEPSEAQRLGSLPDQVFAEALEERLQGLLGCISCSSARVVFPLSGLKADCMGRERIALVGEAAHVIPPIGRRASTWVCAMPACWPSA